MMFSSLRGQGRRAQGAARRCAIRFAGISVESLEDRQLLTAGNFGLNVDVFPIASFVNLLQTPGRWGNIPGQSNPIVLNSSGDPSSDTSLLYDVRVNQSFNGPDPGAVTPDLGGTYHLSFTGQADLSALYPGFSTPFTVQNKAYNATTNTTTADLVVPGPTTQDFFGIAFANTHATSTSAAGTGFSNAKLIRPGYAAGSTQLYTNEFLAALRPFTTLRYLGPDNANGQAQYVGTALATADAAQVDQTGTPWEYLVTLANQSQTDMWINVPQGATDAYVTALAGIIKNGGTVGGVTYAGLNSNLKVYLEYSNEVWGGIPPNLDYQSAAVQNNASNQPLSTFPSNLNVYTNADGSTTSSVYTAVGRRYLERTADIGQIFQSVLGADPTHQRIRPVLGWQENNPGFYPSALDWYRHFFGSASAAFYGMGDANYINPTTYSSVDATIASLYSQETAYAIPDTAAFSALATYYGLANVSYEGGPSLGDTSAADNAVALQASRDPRMEQFVLKHYQNFYAQGGALAMDFSGPFGTWTPQNEWDIAELAQISNPSASPKYRGAVDVAAALPVAVSAGTAVSATSPTSFSATTDSVFDKFSTMSPGNQGYWQLNAASAGVYDLNLATTIGGPGVNGQVEVLLNGKSLRILPVTSVSVDLGNLSLVAGLNTLSLRVTATSANFTPTTFTLSPVASLGVPTVPDGGFEAAGLVSGQYVYDPTGTPWTYSGYAGVTANFSGFTSGNPVAPQGSAVGLVQMTGSMSQIIGGWAAGTYSFSLQAAQRGNSPGQAEDFAVLIDGAWAGSIKPTSTSYQAYTIPNLTLTAGTHLLKIQGLDTVGGDNTAFIDAITVTAGATNPSPGNVTLADPGFEASGVGAGQYAYNPSNTPWTYAGTTGVSGNNSGFTSGDPSAPQGLAVAFLQMTGSVSQAVAGWSTSPYVISFQAAQRNTYGVQAEDFAVQVDGVTVGTFKPAGGYYSTLTTAPFSVAAGSHVVKFVGLDTAGGDNTAFLDSIAITLATGNASPPSVPDSGFEAEAVGVGQIQYNPAGSAWSYAGYSGVAGNNSGFTAGNPVAPEGSKVAFIQINGSIGQSVAGWTAGTHSLSFYAAQRGNYANQLEDFAILIDGVVVDTIRPTGSSYQKVTTASFTVTTGPHTITFRGLDTAGGDNTALIDSISIN